MLSPTPTSFREREARELQLLQRALVRFWKECDRISLACVAIAVVWTILVRFNVVPPYLMFTALSLTLCGSLAALIPLTLSDRRARLWLGVMLGFVILSWGVFSWALHVLPGLAIGAGVIFTVDLAVATWIYARTAVIVVKAWRRVPRRQTPSEVPGARRPARSSADGTLMVNSGRWLRFR